MKLLLVLPVDERMCVHPFTGYPLGLLSLAQYVEDHLPGVTARVISGTPEPDEVAAWAPDLLGLTTLSPFFTQAAAFAGAVKARLPDLPVVAGGHHVTYQPGSLARTIDVAVLGEGEQALLALCERLAARGRLEAEALAAIPGLRFWQGDALQASAERTGYLPVDELPVLRNLQRCEFRSARPRQLHLVTTRGCPHRCRFCSSAPFWKGVRTLPADTVVAQIEELLRPGRPELIEFADDLMIADKDHLRAIHDAMRARALHQRTAYTCWASGAHLDDETLALLQGMNVTGLSIALESGSPAVFRYLKGRWSDPQVNAEAIRRAHAAGIFVHVAVIVGSPPETVDDLEQTYRLLQGLPCHNGSVHLLRPFPGSTLWEECRRKGIVQDGMADWASIESDDVLDPHTIFLGEQASREQVHEYLEKIRALFAARQRGEPPLGV